MSLSPCATPGVWTLSSSGLFVCLLQATLQVTWSLVQDKRLFATLLAVDAATEHARAPPPVAILGGEASGLCGCRVGVITIAK